MSKNQECTPGGIPRPLDISDEDIFDAMKSVSGYLDITPGDFKELYLHAFKHAVERLTRGIKAKDIMTREVKTVKKTTPLREVAALMAKEGVSGVPVLEGDQVVAGILSEKDFLSHMGSQDKLTFMSVVAECLEGTGCLAVSIRGHKAEDIMSSPAITANEDTPVFEIAGIMAERSINRVPVVDKSGRLTGIVSRADLLEWTF